MSDICIARGVQGRDRVAVMYIKINEKCTRSLPVPGHMPREGNSLSRNLTDRLFRARLQRKIRLR